MQSHLQTSLQSGLYIQARNTTNTSNKLRVVHEYIILYHIYCSNGDRGGTVVKVLRYKSESRWFDPS